MKHALILLCALLLMIASTACAKSSTPVQIGGYEDVDACSATGEVRGLKTSGDSFLAVRAGPGTKYDVVDKIVNGQWVFLCDYSTDNGKWWGVVYSSSRHDDCGVSSPIADKRAYAGSCKVGWISAKWVRVIAG